jgi:peptidoglycan/LPS O-acetylase OafA/YrhL
LTDRNDPLPDYLYSLDLLRVVAAVSIVLWHWQHFFFVGTKPGPIDVGKLPLFDWVFFYYSQAGRAAYLFFTLSGFVFYWRYSKRVAEGSVTLEKFSLLRFSRLYPLHFATLLIVAMGQLWFASSQGSSFVYPYNDKRHFFLNLILGPSWGFESGYSFNAPIWTVSVEVLLYVLFFFCCRFFPVRAPILAAFSIFGFLVLRKYNPAIGLGMGSFFLGGSVFLFYRRTVALGHLAWATLGVACLTLIGLTVYLAVVIWAETLYKAGIDINSLPFDSVPFLWRFDAYLESILPKLYRYWPTLVLFPLFILLLALVETYRGSLGKRISFLGNFSYSIYLLHFPLQLFIVTLFSRFKIDRSIYYSPWFMLFFFALLFLFSFGSYHYLEIPAQNLLRRIGLPRRVVEPGEARR